MIGLIRCGKVPEPPTSEQQDDGEKDDDAGSAVALSLTTQFMTTNPSLEFQVTSWHQGGDDNKSVEDADASQPQPQSGDDDCASDKDDTREDDAAALEGGGEATSHRKEDDAGDGNDAEDDNDGERVRPAPVETEFDDFEGIEILRGLDDEPDTEEMELPASLVSVCDQSVHLCGTNLCTCVGILSGVIR